jgi:hypothetical protein
MAEDVVMTSSIEPSRNTEYLEIRVQRDESAIDAMRLLEAIATIIDGPIADTRLHDWSGLPERVRLKVAPLDALQVWALPNPQDGLFVMREAAKAEVRIILGRPRP